MSEILLIYDSRDNCIAIIETSTNTLVVGCQSSIIPNSVTAIGDNAFRECHSLKTINIPNCVTAIGNSAFHCCSSLTAINISDSVTSIGEFAFSETELTYIILPNSISYIDEFAFLYTKIKRIYYLGSEQEFEESGIKEIINSLGCCIYFYSETEPTTPGNYWHYNECDYPKVW